MLSCFECKNEVWWCFSLITECSLLSFYYLNNIWEKCLYIVKQLSNIEWLLTFHAGFVQVSNWLFLSAMTNALHRKVNLSLIQQEILKRHSDSFLIFKISNRKKRCEYYRHLNNARCDAFMIWHKYFMSICQTR